MNEIGVGSITTIGSTAGSSKVQRTQGTGFGEILKDSINAVSRQQNEAAVMSEGLMNGDHSNIHETMIAMEKASISFRLMAKVQTKVIDAYKETMRMQL